MEYRAVGNRCAVDLSTLNLPITQIEALSILENKGFNKIDIDVVQESYNLIGNAIYQRGAKPSQAPKIVDCSSFVKWIYSRRGIWLPRRSIQQRDLGEHIEINDIQSGDVVFISGYIDYYNNDPNDGVGHVGIATGKDTIIHAANKNVHVVESTLAALIGNNLRDVRRYMPTESEVIIFETPVEREVEISDDIRWIVLQSL